MYPKVKKTHAVYNNDKRYFTPAFVIGRDIEEYEETPGFDRDRFKQKVKAVSDRIKAAKG